jgi:TonB family protein
MPDCIRKLCIAAVLCLPLAHAAPPIEPIQKTDPEYTEEARVAELEGTVVLRGTIGEDGFAHDIEVLKPLGLGLDEKAIEAVAQWHFQPTVVSVQIPVEFRLSTKQSRWHLIRVQFDTPPGISAGFYECAVSDWRGPRARGDGRGPVGGGNGSAGYSQSHV